jgi:aspartate aminotransferase
MINLSSRLANLSESQTLAMAKKARALKEQGIDVVNLSLGEPDFDTPDPIKNEAIKAIQDGQTKYPPVAGILALREAISKKLKSENNLDYAANQIVVSTGAKQSLANVFLSILNAGDEVIVPSPFWVSYKEMIKLAEGTVVEVPCSIAERFKITPEALKKAINPRTKAFIFSSPSNPTGEIYSKAELEALAKVFEQHHHICIISDEIYEYINYTALKAQCVIVNGFSKGFAMTGWRLGYIAAPISIAQACEKIQGQITSGTSSISQFAAVHAYQHKDSVAEMLKAFKERRDKSYDILSKVPGVELSKPEGAFYLFPKIDAFFGKSFKNQTIKNADDLCEYLLDEYKVVTVTGNAFGAPNYIRLSYATDLETLLKGIQRIAEGLKALS